MTTREDLIHIARAQLPGIAYDAQNATGALSAAPVLTKLCEIIAHVLHYVIMNVPDRSTQQAPAPAPRPPISPQVAAVPRQVRTIAPVIVPASRPQVPLAPPRQPIPIDDLPDLPPVGFDGKAQGASPSIPGISDVPIQAGVTNVIITAQGTSVVSPSGRTSRLPPGEMIPVEATADLPPELPPPPDGGVNVVLPPGGGALPPELLASLTPKLGE